MPWAGARSNGTAALHVALMLAGAGDGDEVITQPLTFVATCNALAYLGAHPVFVDIDPDTASSLSPEALQDFLETHCERSAGACRNRFTGRRVVAVVPMHTFGLLGRTPSSCTRSARAGTWRCWRTSPRSLGSFIGEAAHRHRRLMRIGAFSFKRQQDR